MEESHMQMEAGIGVMLQQTEEYQNLEGARKDSPPEPSREHSSAHVLSLGFWPLELWENIFLLC